MERWKARQAPDSSLLFFPLLPFLVLPPPLLLPTPVSILHLIDQVAAAERRVARVPVLAPVVPGGRVHVRVDGLISSFRPADVRREGWGVFHLAPDESAVWTRTARPAETGRYLKALRPVRMRLIRPLQDRTWLAVPAFRPDADLFGDPLPVHLVGRARPFASILAGWDGSTCWHAGPDRRADPRRAAALRLALDADSRPDTLRLSGLTPEDRVAYGCAWKMGRTARARRDAARAETRLRGALRRGGGSLDGYADRGQAWAVRWTTAGGEARASLIRKTDLAVLSAGLCLSDRDDDFDLTALVGVVERRPDWMRHD